MAPYKYRIASANAYYTWCLLYRKYIIIINAAALRHLPSSRANSRRAENNVRLLLLHQNKSNCLINISIADMKEVSYMGMCEDVTI